MESLAIGDIMEVIVIGITGSFCQVVLEVVEPVAIVIPGTIGRFYPDLFVGIIEKSNEGDFSVGRRGKVRICYNTEDRTLGQGA